VVECVENTNAKQNLERRAEKVTKNRKREELERPKRNKHKNEQVFRYIFVYKNKEYISWK